MAPPEKIMCFFNANVPKDWITCLDIAAGGLFNNMLFITIMAVLIGGWSFRHGIGNGFMVGGFFTTLSAAGFVAAGLLSPATFILSLTLLVIGLIIKITTVFSKT